MTTTGSSRQRSRRPRVFPRPIAISAGLVVLLLAAFAGFRVAQFFGHFDGPRRQAALFADSVQLGSDFEQARAATRATSFSALEFGELALQERFGTDAGELTRGDCRATALVARTPLEWGARNWDVYVVVEREQVAAVLYRCPDGFRIKPGDAPPDRVANLGPCIRRYFFPVK